MRNEWFTLNQSYTTEFCLEAEMLRFILLRKLKHKQYLAFNIFCINWILSPLQNFTYSVCVTRFHTIASPHHLIPLTHRCKTHLLEKLQIKSNDNPKGRPLGKALFHFLFLFYTKILYWLLYTRKCPTFQSQKLNHTHFDDQIKFVRLKCSKSSDLISTWTEHCVMFCCALCCIVLCWIVLVWISTVWSV